MPTSLPHDDKLAVLFKHHAVKNEAKSKEAGRPIFDDLEVCEVRPPGSRGIYVFPSTSVSHTSGDGMFGTEEVKVTYAERFSRQYRQFKEQQAQTITGTPLAHVPFLTEARRAELRALNIYTAEQLAMIDGQELKNLGSGGRDLKNRAMEYIEASKTNAPNLAAMAELEQLKARNAILEEDNRALKATENADQQFETMDLDQLRDFITSNTGHTPHGSLNRKTLERMARDATKADA